MTTLAELRPARKNRVYDILQRLGYDVSAWEDSKRGLAGAAMNPKFCYEWAFVQDGQPVVLNLWHSMMEERQGEIVVDNNLRPRVLNTAHPIAAQAWKRRGEAFEAAIRTARDGRVPIRAIINDGYRRDRSDPNAKASRVRGRVLDAVPWTLTSYSERTGDFTLSRGNRPAVVDQFDVPPLPDELPARITRTHDAFVRDPKVRGAALQRSAGACEYCGARGFEMSGGRVYLETHHVVPLSEGGHDAITNVAAVCANHHRQAHHGLDAATIRTFLLKHIGARRTDGRGTDRRRARAE